MELWSGRTPPGLNSNSWWIKWNKRGSYDPLVSIALMAHGLAGLEHVSGSAHYISLCKYG